MVWRLLLLYTTLVVLLSATGAVPLPNVKDSLKAAGQAAEKGLAALNLNIFSGQATWFKPVTEGGPTGGFCRMRKKIRNSPRLTNPFIDNFRSLRTKRR
jgi:hypothetical protein